MQLRHQRLLALLAQINQTLGWLKTVFCLVLKDATVDVQNSFAAASAAASSIFPS
jgi:hypothetical protein